MLIFLILVNHSEHLIVYDFHQKAVKQRPKLEYMFSDFFCVCVRARMHARVCMYGVVSNLNPR